jgi:LPS export ABC transporter protein LptC
MNKIPAYRRKQIGVEEGRKIESYYSEDSKVKAKLTAPLMLRYESTNNASDSTYTLFPNSLHVDFYNDSLQVASKLDAKYGKYFQFQNKVYLRDSVVVINIIKGDTLHCDDLWWDQNTKMFYTENAVRINTKDKLIPGRGLQAAQDFSWYVITHIDNGSILAPDSGLPK